MVEEKNIVCIGAGIQGIRMLALLENREIDRKVICFLDNDKKKSETIIRYDSVKKEVHLFDDAEKYISNNTVVLITCMDYLSIYKQMSKLDCFNNVICVSVLEMARNELLSSDYE